MVTYFASHRTHEVGLRIALGASSRDVAWLVLREVNTYVAIGVIAGAGVAFGLGRVLGSLLSGISPADPWALAGAGLSIIVIVMGAVLVPAVRAARTEPAVALRHE